MLAVPHHGQVKFEYPVAQRAQHRVLQAGGQLLLGLRAAARCGGILTCPVCVSRACKRISASAQGPAIARGMEEGCVRNNAALHCWDGPTWEPLGAAHRRQPLLQDPGATCTFVGPGRRCRRVLIYAGQRRLQRLRAAVQHRLHGGRGALVRCSGYLELPERGLWVQPLQVHSRAAAC